MKIMFLTGAFPPAKCGVGDYTSSLTNALAKKNVRVGVLTNTGSSVEGQCEVFPVVENWSIIEIGKIVRVITSWSPDIVHIQYPTQGYNKKIMPCILPLISWLLGVKVVQTWHEIYGPRYFLFNFHRVLLKVLVPGRIIVVRPNYRESLDPILGWLIKRRGLTFIRGASAIPVSNLSLEEKKELRNQYITKPDGRLLVYFGFMYPHKGVELIFEIADPLRDFIILIGDMKHSDPYCKSLLKLIKNEIWIDKVFVTGYLDVCSVADYLYAADAVVLPFKEGGGEWNSSIYAAVLQGVFVLTTSKLSKGYDETLNIYYARSNDVLEMKEALNIYNGKVIDVHSDEKGDDWVRIADEHMGLYENI